MDPTVRRVHFNALPELTRHRLVEAGAGRGQPAPVLTQKTAGWGGVLGWLLLGLTFGGASLWLLSYDFGHMRDSGQQSFGFLAALLVGSWLTFYSLLAALRRIRLDRAMPIRRGRYLFPTDLVVATEPILRIYPLSQLMKLDPVHHFNNGSYTGTDFNFDFEGGHRETFTVPNKAHAEQALAYFDRCGFVLAQAVRDGDDATVRSLDIFYEAQDHPLWQQLGTVVDAPAQVPSGPRAHNLPVLLKWASITAFVGLVLAAPAWFVRNYLSDEAAYRNAVACDSTACFRSYLRGNGRHADEVRDEHLPRAAFGEAERAGTVTALREFILEYPRTQWEERAHQVIHQRFEVVRGQFMAQAATNDPNMPVFMGELLAWLELNGSPPVHVRFNAPSGQMLEEIDRDLPPNTSPVAPHFTAERSAPREQHITKVLQRGFGAVFPEDVMSLEHRGRILPTTPPETLHATIDVSYVIRPSGSIYIDDVTQRQFIGIHNDFVVRMAIPGSTRSHSFQLQVQPPQRFSVGYDRFDVSGQGPTDGAVYTTMASRAFEQLGTQLPMVFFRPGSPAYQRAISDGGPGRQPQFNPGLPAGLPPMQPPPIPGSPTVP